MSDTLNPYGAPTPGQFEKEPRASRAIAIAVTCGIIVQALIGTLGLIALAMFAWLLVTNGMQEAQSVVQHTPRVFAAISFLAVCSPLLAFGIYKRSRVCAVISALLMVAGNLVDIFYSGAAPSLANIAIVPAMLALLAFVGVLGTIAHHRREAAPHIARRPFH